MNVPYLIEVLAEQVKGNIPGEMPVISSVRHYHALERAEERLRTVALVLDAAIDTISPTTNYQLPTTDLLAQDIRQAMYHLGEITGEISTEDVLGNIFMRFCIGK